jgi:hypothetical protein
LASTGSPAPWKVNATPAADAGPCTISVAGPALARLGEAVTTGGPALEAVAAAPVAVAVADAIAVGVSVAVPAGRVAGFVPVGGADGPDAFG